MKRDYSPARRAAYARALRAAKDHMWNGDGEPRPEAGEHRYICLALTKAGFVGDIPRADAKATREELCARMNGFRCIEDWLSVAHGVPLADEATMQGYRFVWIDSMIEEFER